MTGPRGRSASGQAARTKNASGPWSFDAQGNLLWSDDGLGRTVYAYDRHSRLINAVYPDGRCLSLDYDDQGNVVRRGRPDQGQDRFSYDASGRLRRATLADRTTYTFDYDGDQLATAEVPGCRSDVIYDDEGHPACYRQTIAGKRYESAFRYDEDGQLAAVRVPGVAGWLRYEYDDRKRLVEIAYDPVGEGQQNAARPLVQLGYDEAARQVVVHFANGVTQSLATDARNQVKEIKVKLPDGQLALDLVYRSGPRGRIEAIGEQRFTYDGQERMIAYGSLFGKRTRLTYDAAGNRRSRQQPGQDPDRYHYDKAGRLVRWQRPNGLAVRYGYDGVGQLTARADDRQNWTYHYDGVGQLVRARRDGVTIADYINDHQGRRVRKQSRQETVVYHRDPWGNLLAETRDGDETRVYLGPAGQHLGYLVICGEQEEARFWHSDHLGSVRLVTDAAGQVTGRYDFDPFGNWQRDPATDSEPAVFAGHAYDESLELYECGVRLYDPQLGRFTTPDSYTFSADDPRLLWLNVPAETRHQLRRQQLQAWQREGALRNRYVYALNSPLTYVDRDGHNAGLYTLYILLSIFWALPYTLVGFLFFEVWLNWITFAWLWDIGNREWRGESSDRLGAWAWWIIGGLSGMMVIGGGAFTMGNIVIANANNWNQANTTTNNFGIPVRHDDLTAAPPANLLTQRGSLVEHELRHTNQYGWWGPFMMPWVLILYFLFQNLVNTAFSAIIGTEVHLSWETIKETFFEEWWHGVITVGVGLLIAPGAYWWDYIVRGGYSSSWFEQDAAQHSGSSNNINVRANANRDSVSTGGDVIISVIADPTLVAGITLGFAAGSDNNSGAAAPVDITPAAISNLRVFRYTAGSTAGKDTLTAGAGSSTDTVEIDVQ
jgi:RHS repeat-associated protein